MKILVACEESQEVTKAFRAKGHEAYSCDIQDCSGGHPEWHLRCDVRIPLSAKNGGLSYWDMIIAFPPCDHLSKAGAAHWKKPHKIILQHQALEFVKIFMNHQCDKVVIENPVGRISTAIRKPDQKIHPYEFGHPYTKETCLWLKGVPILRPTNIVEPIANWVKPGNKRNRRFNDVPEGAGGKKSIRSKTFPGIAQAMADQWG